MGNEIIRNYMEDYISEVQANGKLFFTLEDVKERFSANYETAIKFSLNKLFKKGKIVSAYKGFYVIVPPEYQHRKILPPELFLDHMFNYLKREYYLGLLSASVLHGASHQQAMESYVFINKPALRSTKAEGVKINYLVRTKLPQFGIEKRKTETGFINISNPELTAIDLVEFNNRIGGINRAATVLYELSEEMSAEKMNEVLRNNFSLSVVQRLGYILDTVLKKNDLSYVIQKFLADKKIFRVPIRADKKKNGFPVHPIWKVIENHKIETDFN
jgi:predicted transcriptional regulator of viral defense system